MQRFLLFALLIAMTACATGAIGEKKSAPPVSSHPPDEIVKMSVWTVPKSDFKVGETGYIQIRMTPLLAMEKATLRVTSPDSGLTILSPAEIELSNLQPEDSNPPPNKNSPPDPPALGMTLVYHFQAVAKRAGNYTVKVEVTYRGKIQSQDMTIETK